MPSFSAKVYEQLALNRTEQHDVMYLYIKEHPECLSKLIPAGHKIGQIKPIISQISDEDVAKWKEQFGGKKEGA